MTFLKELILIKQVHQKSVIFVTIGTFLNNGIKFQSYVCSRWHDLVMMSINLINIAILCMKGSYYCCIISGISKNEAIMLMENADLAEKSRTL